MNLMLRDCVDTLKGAAIDCANRNGLMHPYVITQLELAVRISSDMEADYNEILKKLDIIPPFDLFGDLRNVLVNARAKVRD